MQHDIVKFIAGIQGEFNIHKSTKVIHCIKKNGQKSYDHRNRC